MQRQGVSRLQAAGRKNKCGVSMIPKSRLSTLGTHALALFGGAGIWGAGHALLPMKAIPPESRAAHRSSYRSGSLGAAGIAESLLDRLETTLAKRNEGKEPAIEIRKLNEAADALEPAGDVRQAALQELSNYAKRVDAGESPEKVRFELSVRFLHWMREDPKGMISFIYDSQAEPFWSGGMQAINSIVLPAMERSTTQEVLSWLGANEYYDEEFRWLLAQRLSATTDIAGIAALKEHSPGDWEETRKLLAELFRNARVSGVEGLVAEYVKKVEPIAISEWGLGLPERPETVDIYRRAITGYINQNPIEARDWIMSMQLGDWRRERALMEYSQNSLWYKNNPDASQWAIDQITDPKVKGTAISWREEWKQRTGRK